MKKGFTLAEVLIALVVIGIISAITLTTVMPNIQERVNSQRQANIVYKVTQATNLMKANGAMINGFESTEAFVDELQKYLKIMKRCDSEHIADCWPTKKVKTSEGKEFEVKDAKKRKNLGFDDDYKNTKNVGIVLSDGACIIMTYNPDIPGIGIGDSLVSSLKVLPVGGKYKEYLDYTTNTTQGLSFVMDVNGAKGPNREKDLNTSKLYDIRTLNAAHFDVGCGGTKVNGTCFSTFETPTFFNCVNKPDNEFCAQGSDSKGYTSSAKDYWVGAMINCSSIGGRLPTQDELYEICINDELKSKLGLSDYLYGFWSSDIIPSIPNAARYVYFDGCQKQGSFRNSDSDRMHTLCLSN